MTLQYIIYNKVRNFIEQGKVEDVNQFGLLMVYRRMYEKIPGGKLEIDNPSDAENIMAMYNYNILLNHYLISCIEHIMILPNPNYIAYLSPVEIVRIAFSHEIQITEPYQISQT